MKVLILGLIAFALGRGATADEVYLTSGGQLSGRIVSRTETQIEIDIGAGRITVPTASVARVEVKKSALEKYEERAAKIPATDADAWVALGDWASREGLGTQARAAYTRAKAAAPDDPRANEGLGNVNVDGRWVTQVEGYRLRGYVPFEGDWITPAEHEVILRERAAEAAQEKERQQAEAAEQEALAQERARAAQAERQAAQIPVWAGWGAGPVTWRTEPVVIYPYGPQVIR
jgi:hypothetical protein